jgi:hypothetical protein
VEGSGMAVLVRSLDLAAAKPDQRGEGNE